MKTLKLRILAVAVLATAGLLLQNSKALADQVAYTAKDLQCLAKNIYYEARGESTKGKLAVAQVTLNRVQSPRYQSTICKVVYAKYQFSWTRDSSRRAPRGQAWQDALAIATTVLEQGVALPKFSALYFHSRHIVPHWSRKKRKLARIGNHVFYS